MEAVFTATSRWNPTAKCLKWKPNSSGSRSCKRFITVIRETSHIETSNLRIYCSMRPKSVLKWSILGSQRAFLMREKSRSFAVHRHTWPLRSSARSSIRDLQLIFGLSASSSMHFSAASSRSRDRMTRNYIITSALKNFNSLIMSLLKLVSSFRSYSRRVLSAASLPNRFFRIRGLRSLLSSTSNWVQTLLMALLSRPKHKISIRLKGSNPAPVVEQGPLHRTIIASS